MKNSKFYNILSQEYDTMIKFENSLKNKLVSLKNFIEPNFKTALDLGCGTGVDSIALTQLGLNVDAVDHSSEMIKIAIRNANKFNLKISFIHSNLSKLSMNKNYNFIVSLGNTLANLSLHDLEKFFEFIRNHLSENGRAVVQTLNYRAMPSSGEYILNKFENDNIIIIRKYLFNGETVDFIIEITDKKNQTSEEIKTKIYPHSAEKFKELCKKFSCNFSIYGNLTKAPFEKELSNNIVLELSVNHNSI